MKIKLLESSDPYVLESEANRFMKNVNVIDIRYDVIKTNDIYFYSIVILYEPK